MIRIKPYREALERVVSAIPIDAGVFLVTGASGLIGSCLIDLLMVANDSGRHFDIYALGRSRERLQARFSAFSDFPSFHIIEQDIRKPLDLGISYDYIVHGASNADPRNYALFPAETMLINLEGAFHVLNYCKEKPSTRILMMSTFEVYGNADKDIYKETDIGVIDINKIRSCYPESKRSMEILTRCYVEEFGIDAVIGRLASIYGPTMTKDDSKAHAQFIRNGLRKEDIVLKSNGEQLRTYCYVIDAVTGLLSIIANGRTGDVYNISNEKSIVSIYEVAQTVAEICQTKVILKKADETEKEGFSMPQNCILDNAKLRSLGWEGKYDLYHGLKECLLVLESKYLR